MENEVDTLIIGAGLSGLMMGYLQKRNYLIIEAAERLNFDIATPFHLHAPLDWLPTTWKEIDVHHHCWDGERFHRIPDLKMMNDFSRKIVGKIVDTSLKFMDGSIKRGFVPESGNAGEVLRDLFNETSTHLALGAQLVHLDPDNKAAAIAFAEEGSRVIRYKNLVSTIPLPALLKMLRMEFHHRFTAEPITTIFFDVPPEASVDAFQVVNITDPSNIFYRASLMDQKVILETMNPDHETEESQLTHTAAALANALWKLNLRKENATIHVIRPGKFHPIPKTARKQLLAKLTNDWQIYCLGRYATWSYKRIDHIAEDAHSILKIMKAGVPA